MTTLKLGSACLNQIPLDWEGNKERIVSAIEQAKKESIAILCLPELCISGYGCEDAFFNKGLVQTAFEKLEEIAETTQGIIVALGLPIFLEENLYNTVALVADKQILGFVAKRYLASDGIHYEQRWFKPWPENKIKEIILNNKIYPFGDLFFNFNGIKLGFEICEDAWVKDRPGHNLAQYGIDIILNPSASHFAFSKFESRKKLVQKGSKEFNCAYVYSNLSGNESGRAIYDAGSIIANYGEILQLGRRFSFKDIILTSAIIEIQQPSNKKQKEAKEKEIRIDYKIKEAKDSHSVSTQASWEQSKFIKEEEFARAVSLGLFDYLRKSKAQGFVVSLSGGADSATVASLVYLMLQLSFKELGLEHVIKKLGLKNTSAKNLKELTKELLFCVYQSSANSGEITRNAARTLAEAIDAEYREINISSIISAYQELIESSINRKLSWEEDDLALQNIQARVRAPSAWMFANIRNSLLLVTSNRSEAAVGYATMDGDTAGSISPIGGVDKAFIRVWLKWLEKYGLNNELKISALELINEQEPTAELRPGKEKQTDEKDLMPYEFLTAVERAAFLERLLPLEIFEKLSIQFSQFKKEDIKLWIKKFFTLWCRNQWKRERYAPSFHLDDQSSDPKTWCRFPILNSGFIEEIDKL